MRQGGFSTGAVAALAVSITLLAGRPAPATTDSSWLSSSGGNWSEPANWTGGAVPNGVDHVARLTPPLTFDQTIMIDEAMGGQVTLGSLYLDIGRSKDCEIAGAPGTQLVLDVASGSALIHMDSVLSVAVPVVLRDSLIVEGNGYGHLGVHEPIIGAVPGVGLTVTGRGTVYLYAPSSHTGPTVVGPGGLETRVENAIAQSSGVVIDGGPGDYAYASFAIHNFDNTVAAVTLVRGRIGGYDGILTAPLYDLRWGNVSARLGGSGDLVKTTADRVVLSGSSTYTGTTHVREGILEIEHPNALGTADGDTVVYHGASLMVSDNITVATGEPVRIAGPGVSDFGALRSDGGYYNTWTGPVTLVHHATIGGGLTITGPVDDRGKGYTLTTTGGYALTFKGANTYTGPTLVRDGSLRVRHDSALGATTQGTTVLPDATLVMADDTTIVGEPLALGGALEAWGGDNTWAGPLQLTGNARIGATEGTLTVATPIDDGGAGYGPTTPSGYGTLILPAANRYSGPTTLEGGALRATEGVGLPAAGNLVLAGGVFEANGPTTFTRPLGAGPGQVQWTGGGFSAYGGKVNVSIGGMASPATLTVTHDGFGSSNLVFGSRTADSPVELRNPIDLGGRHLGITVYDNAATLDDVAILSGALSNGGIGKTGPGMLILTGHNTYQEKTYLKAGVLRAAVGVSLPDQSNLTIHGGVFESDGPASITRDLGQGSGQINMDRDARNAGFAAHGGKLTVAIGGMANPTLLDWGSNFLYHGSPLVFGSQTADSEVEFQNPIELTGNADVWVDDNPATLGDFATISGVLSRESSGGMFIKGGPGMLVLTGANTYRTPTRVRRGILRANDGQGLPSSSSLYVVGGTFESDGEDTLIRPVDGSRGSLYWSDGGFAAHGGKLTLSLGGLANPQQLTWETEGFYGSYPDGFTFGSPTATHEVEFRNPIDLNGQVRTVTVNDNPDAPGDFVTFSGALSNGGLTKEGAGTLHLTGRCIYTGDTFVREGVLKLGFRTPFFSETIHLGAGCTFDLQDFGGFSLPAPRALRGSGKVVGDVVVGGTVAPGEGFGALSFDGATWWTSTSILDIELGGTTRGTDYDVLLSSGPIELGNGTLAVTLVEPFEPVLGDAFDILGFSELTGTFRTVSLPDLPDGLFWNTNNLYTQGRISVLPEPATLALLAVGGLGLVLRRRR